MRRSRRDDLQPPSFDTNLHQKDFDLRFGGTKDLIGRQRLEPIKPKAKKKQNQTQQLKSKVSSHKQRQRQKDETKNSSQCNECGERYSIQDLAIHESQCRSLKALKVDFATDIGNNGTCIRIDQVNGFKKNHRIRICTKGDNRGNTSNNQNRASHGRWIDKSTVIPDVNSKHDETDPYQHHQMCWKAFVNKCSQSTSVTFDEIPFLPLECSVASYSIIGLSKDSTIEEKKASIREVLIRFHPDRFIQRFRSVLHTEDIPMIMKRLNEIVRVVSQLRANLS